MLDSPFDQPHICVGTVVRLSLSRQNDTADDACKRYAVLRLDLEDYFRGFGSVRVRDGKSETG